MNYLLSLSLANGGYRHAYAKSSPDRLAEATEALIAKGKTPSPPVVVISELSAYGQDALFRALPTKVFRHRFKMMEGGEMLDWESSDKRHNDRLLKLHKEEASPSVAFTGTQS